MKFFGIMLTFLMAVCLIKADEGSDAFAEGNEMKLPNEMQRLREAPEMVNENEGARENCPRAECTTASS